jgi:hypothetical protein
VPVEQYADTAFAAKGFPSFGYGCAVFMQSDIVDFQRQGWKPEEIMAGLCNVLPKNIWLYVSQIPNLSAIGTRFLLQGGTQYNLAAVKAQVDFIERCMRQHSVQDHPGRGHPLLLLQEQVPADLHRRQDDAGSRRLQAAGQDQSSAGRGCAAADHRHLRKGHGGEYRGDARHQGQPR